MRFLVISICSFLFFLLLCPVVVVLPSVLGISWNYKVSGGWTCALSLYVAGCDWGEGLVFCDAVFISRGGSVDAARREATRNSPVFCFVCDPGLRSGSDAR